MTINSKFANWLLDQVEKLPFVRKHLTTIEFSFKRSYHDDEQIYESFAKQCIAEMREQIDELEKELLNTKEGGK